MSVRVPGWRFGIPRVGFVGSQGRFGGPRMDFWSHRDDLGTSKIDFWCPKWILWVPRWILESQVGMFQALASLADGRTPCQILQSPQQGAFWGLRIPRVNFGFSVSFALPGIDSGISGWVLGFWSRFLWVPGRILGVLSWVFGVPGWILGFQHPQCEVQGGSTVGQTPHGHHVDVGPQELGEGLQNDAPAGLHHHPGVCSLDLRRRRVQLLGGTPR